MTDQSPPPQPKVGIPEFDEGLRRLMNQVDALDAGAPVRGAERARPNSAITHRVPPQENLEKAIQAGKAALGRLEAAIPKGHEYLTSVTTARGDLARHGELMQIAENLADTKVSAAREKGLAAALRTFPGAINAEMSLPQIQAHVAKELGHRTGVLENLHAKYAGSWSTLNPRPPANRSRWSLSFSNPLERYDSWLAGKSRGAKIGLGLTEAGLGVVLMYVGGEWVGQALSGTKSKKASLVSEQEGFPSHVAVVAPIGMAERVLKGALGGLTTAGGFLVIGSGFGRMTR